MLRGQREELRRRRSAAHSFSYTEFVSILRDISQAITFVDFIELLQSVSGKVYPSLKTQPNKAFKKLMVQK